MVIIGGTGSVMGTLMGTAFVVLLPESMEWLSAGLKGSAIDKALSLNNNITFLREIAIGVIIIAFLMFEPDGLAHRWRQIKTYWKLYPFSIEVGTEATTFEPTNNRRKRPMTTKSLLSTASLALPIGGASAAAQAQIAIGHLADYSGATSDVGTPYGQAVADTFAWVNKNGGVGGKQLNVDTNDYGYQVPRAIALYKNGRARQQGRGDHGLGHRRHRSADRLPRAGQDPRHLRLLCRGADRSGRRSGKAKPAPYNFFYGPSYSTRCARC